MPIKCAGVEDGCGRGQSVLREQGVLLKVQVPLLNPSNDVIGLQNGRVTTERNLPYSVHPIP